MFNDLLRTAEPGSIALIPAGVDAPGYSNLPAAFGVPFKQMLSKNFYRRSFDLSVRDTNTGFTFFNVEGGEYDYESMHIADITGGRLLISKDFANALGRPSDAGAIVGKISVARRCNRSRSTRSLTASRNRGRCRQSGPFLAPMSS